MAFQHIYFNDQIQFGRSLRRVLQLAEDSDIQMGQVRQMMIMMVDGTTDNAAHFTEVAARFGFIDNASAMAAFAELDSAYSKTSGDGSVTNVRTARDQLFNKLRG